MGKLILATKRFTNDEIETIRNQVAKGATDEELKMFLHLADKYNLDPFSKQIWFIKRPKKVKDKNGNWDYKRKPDNSIDYDGVEPLIMASRDGYLSYAQESENWVGMMSMAVREGDHFEIDSENYKVHHKFGAKRGKIIGAWAKVDHKKNKPFISWAEFSEYNDSKSTTWNRYQSAMIIKVAEVFALKRQFGIHGIVTKEEMWQKNTDDFDENEEQKVIIMINQDTLSDIKQLASDLNISDNDMMKVLNKSYNVNDLSELTEENATELKTRLQLIERKEKDAV
jgi:phage recombination protein Bet